MEEKRDSLVNDGQGEGNESKKGKRKGRGRGRGRRRGAVLTWFRGVARREPPLPSRGPTIREG